MDGELRKAVKELTTDAPARRSVKAWLRGIQLEEGPKDGPANVAKGKGDNWRLFTKLAQAVWEHGKIPPQLLWGHSTRWIGSDAY